MEYILVSYDGSNACGVEVCRLLALGWELYGPVVVNSFYMPDHGVPGTVYTQAMIRPNVKYHLSNTTPEQKKD